LNLIRVMPAKEKRGEMKNPGSTSDAAEQHAANGKRSLKTITTDPVEGLDALPELPASERVFKTDGDIRVPFRRISVGAGEAPVDVYDPSGPRTADLHAGLPKLRQPWVDRRIARGDTNFSQMHYARRGEITEEMRFCALREGWRPNSYATRWRAGGPSFRPTASTRRRSR